MVKFYKEKLGLEHLFTVPKMAFFNCGGIRLMLAMPEHPEFDHPSSIIYFREEDIEKHYQVLMNRGVKFEDHPHLVAKMEDHDLWMAFFKDEDGNLLSILSEVSRS